MGEKGKNYRGDRITEFTLEKSTNIFVRMLVGECGPGDLGSEVCTLTSIISALHHRARTLPARNGG